MKQIAQNYKSGALTLLDVPAPSCRAGGVLVRTAYSVISAGTELMKISESKLSLLGKARARPDQIKKVVKSVRQQGLLGTYRKVMSRLDSYTPLGYSLAGQVVEVGSGVADFQVGQAVACCGNQYAFHAEYNWVPVNMCVPVPAGVSLDQAAFATMGAIALQSMRQADIQFGETACVIGLGLVGQILTRLLRRAGVFVVGVDMMRERCRLAEAAGASLCAPVATPEYAAFPRNVATLTGGHGADCIFITAAGDDNGPLELAVELARDRARIIDIGKCKLDLAWNDFNLKELDVRFSRSYGPGRYDPLYEEGGIDYPIAYVRWTARRNMECVLAMLGDGQLEFSSLITDVFPFESAVDIYERMNKGELKGLGVLFRYRDDAPLVRRMGVARVPRAASRKVRLGVVGAGNYASSMLLPHLAADSDVELMEVATNTALSAANAVKKFRFSRSSTDAASLLQADDIDAVLIATRHATHAQLVCAALKTGKAVFVEKPLALSRDQLAEIRRTIDETGNDRLMVGFNRRFAPLLAQLKADWGRRSGRHVLQYRVNADQLDKGSWYAQSQSEGARFAGEGGHFIDTVSWWLDADPVQVSAAATLGDPDNLVATYQYPDGSLATIHYLTQGDPRVPKERMEIFGDGKAASFNNFESYELFVNNRSKTKRARLDKGQRAEMQAFMRAVKTGGPMPIGTESLLVTTFATLAAQESTGTNLPVLLALEQLRQPAE